MKLRHSIAVVVLSTAISSTSPAETPPKEIVVEAYVDGPSILHVKPDALYWENVKASKPGMWGGKDEPTYINGNAWTVKWHKSRERTGTDKSFPTPVGLGTIELEIQILAVTRKRGEAGIEKRAEPGTRTHNNEFLITIPDPEPEARWYKFVIRKKQP